MLERNRLLESDMIMLIRTFHHANGVRSIQGNQYIYVSRLRACWSVIPDYSFVMAGIGPALVRIGRYSESVCYSDEYYSLLLLGGHAVTSPEGGEHCSLSTFNYGVASHLAFQLMQRNH